MKLLNFSLRKANKILRNWHWTDGGSGEVKIDERECHACVYTFYSWDIAISDWIQAQAYISSSIGFVGDGSAAKRAENIDVGGDNLFMYVHISIYI